MTTHDKHQIIVLGAGYAGLATAQRLARRLYRDEVALTLVAASPEFVERPRLHQAATGQSIRAMALADLVAGLPLTLRIAHVQSVDADAHRLVLEDGAVLPYDTLVLAPGSRIAAQTVPGADVHTLRLDDRRAAADAAGRLGELAVASGRVVVCGGGLTGLEIASEVADRWPALEVRMVSGSEPGGRLSTAGRAHLGAALDALGVVRTVGQVARVDADALVLSDGERVEFDLCFWAGGFEPSPLVAASGVAVDAAGRAHVDATMRSTSHPDVWVVGDAAAVAGPWGDSLAMGCRTGAFTAAPAAESVVAALTGGRPRSVRFRYWHECLSIGRRSGLVQLLRADGTPKEQILTGRTAIVYKNVVLDSARVLFRHPSPWVARRRHLRTPAIVASSAARIGS